MSRWLYVILFPIFCSFAPGTPLLRTGDEIVVAGQFFHTGTPVVLWMDPGGYDAYRVERRFSPFESSGWKESINENHQLKTPNRYGMRLDNLTPEQINKFRCGGWDLEALKEIVDQFVIHYDACGLSCICFKQLHDVRGLSIHFLLDVDGTIYQTLDLKERAWHATTSNNRSIGIEIANIGAYPEDEHTALKKWYAMDYEGRVRIQIPKERAEFIRKKEFEGFPVREHLVHGQIQGLNLAMYDLTAEQYESLAKLTAALCSIFPKIKCEVPRDPDGQVITHKLTDEELAHFQGILGHYHIQSNKQDPGPAFQWDRLINNVKNN